MDQPHPHGSRKPDRACSFLIPRLLEHFEHLDQQPALRFKSEGEYHDLSYRGLKSILFAVATGLMRLDLRPGDRSVILSNSCPDWVYADLGSLLAGAVTSAIYPSMPSTEIAFILKDLEARFLFVEDEEQLEKVIAIREDLPFLERVFVFRGKESYGEPWIMPLGNLLYVGSAPSRSEVQTIRDLAARTTEDQTLAVVYTGGAADTPKGVILTHGNYAATFAMVERHLGSFQGLDTTLSFLPLAHAFERLAGYYLVLFAGHTICYAEDPGNPIRSFRNANPHFAVAVPRFFEQIYHELILRSLRGPIWRKPLFEWSIRVGRKVRRSGLAPERLPMPLSLQYRLAEALTLRRIRSMFGNRLRFMISGSGPLNPAVIEFFHAAGVLILEGWGSTEATAPCTLNTPDHHRLGTVGRPLPEVEVRVGADKELEVRGPNMFTKYWNNPPATEAAFTADGFYKTGDLGEIDDQGWVRITERKRSIITMADGCKIAPAPIENALHAQAHIARAYIHGTNRDFLTALLELDEKMLQLSATREKVASCAPTVLARHPVIESLIRAEVARANAELPDHMQIRAYRIMERPFSVQAGELTPTQKLRHSVIERRYKPLFDSMYA
ncbi:Long-chain fatty acid--CoA ligase [Sulfidibacter corallicola]|uniref:Long-chain fatty acid--CoA ligase n=1 Tax=Sulfidibacter corallicola TaxID=2818388 RepID=A0A8A4TUX1_SULCO|nr:long-chain fatty acid--CoA ligase [Sulfidibacter corallicola]QTD50325.1 long-chain fatty acid--CoA ligase [Sulfidibacter corallicola]